MQGSEHLIVLDQVAAEINRRLPDAAAFNEGNHGGVCCVYARVKCDEVVIQFTQVAPRGCGCGDFGCYLSQRVRGK
jgi:hypothetical protein